MEHQPRLALVAGESSGDLLGGHLLGHPLPAANPFGAKPGQV